MLKGVNHKVIEVNRPDSLYFDRAVFYLRPEADDIPLHAALSETERLLAPRRRRPFVQHLVWFLLGALAMGGGCAFFLRIMG